LGFVRCVRYGVVGAFFVGGLDVIQGCDAREGVLFAFLVATLNFCTGPNVVDNQPVAPVFPKICLDGSRNEGPAGQPGWYQPRRRGDESKHLRAGVGELIDNKKTLGVI